MDNLHVAHDWQRRSVGRALMRAAGEWICAPNSRYVWGDARTLL